MTDLRTAAEMALEALETEYRGAEACARILRAALAETRRQPLTEEEILSNPEIDSANCGDLLSDSLIELVRAVERAHGIGAKND